MNAEEIVELNPSYNLTGRFRFVRIRDGKLKLEVEKVINVDAINEYHTWVKAKAKHVPTLRSMNHGNIAGVEGEEVILYRRGIWPFNWVEVIHE